MEKDVPSRMVTEDISSSEMQDGNKLSYLKHCISYQYRRRVRIFKNDFIFITYGSIDY